MLAQDQLYPNPDVLVTLLGNHDLLRFMSEPGATVTGLNLAFTVILTTRGSPQIFYGDEIAMPGGGDPDNRRDFPGGFPGDARNAFTEPGRSAEQRAALDHFKRLTRLRAELEPLRRGALVNLYVAEQQYAYARVTDRPAVFQAVLVVINNDTRAATWEFRAAPFADGVTLQDRLGSAGEVRIQGGRARLTLPARTAAIFVQK